VDGRIESRFGLKELSASLIQTNRRSVFSVGGVFIAATVRLGEVCLLAGESGGMFLSDTPPEELLLA